MTEADSTGFPPTYQNRRTFPRRAAKGLAVCRTGKYGMGKPIRGKLLNLSPAGAGATMPQEFTIGSDVELQLDPVGSAKPLVIPAKVRVSIAQGEACWYTGFEFEKRFTMDKLANYIR